MTTGTIMGRRLRRRPIHRPQGAAHDLLEGVGIGLPRLQRGGQRLSDVGQDLLEDGVVLGHTPGLDVRAGQDRASRGLHDGVDRYEALLRQDATVLKLGLVDLAHGGSVNIDVAAGNLAGDADTPA